MAQSLGLKIRGLYTFLSDLSAVPEGALSQASNIVIDQDDIAAPRRGFDYLRHQALQTQFSDPSYRAAKIAFYQGQILCHYGPVGAPIYLAYHTTTGWVNYPGTYAPPSSTVPMRFVEANRNLYFTTSNGVFKLDSYTGTPRQIGAPPGLDVTAALGGTSNGWLAPGATARYRVVWDYTDANTNFIEGAPSQGQEVTNSTTTIQCVNLTSTIPPAVLAAGTSPYYYQVYRSQQTGGLQGGVQEGYIEPNDELGLVYQANPTNTDLTNGYVSIADIVPDSLIGATIYTAASQGGIGQENYPVPLANDIAVFRNCMFFANTSDLQSYNLSLLATGSPNGIQVGDTFTIGGVTYTAATTENIASAQFAVSTAFLLVTTGTTAASSTTLSSVASTTGVAVGNYITGNNIPTGTYVVSVGSGSVVMSQAATAAATAEAITFTGDSASQAIRDTALSLVRVVNRHVGSTVFAYYESGTTSLPGQLLFQGRGVGQAAFAATSSRATCWNPALPTSGTTQTSTNDVNVNYLFYSQTLEPEAVPLAFFESVGSGDQPILRIIPLRDSLFILKTDGIYRLYGSDPTNFQTSPLDYTAILLAPESAVALNNQIYALTSQGVVTISETGVQIMSRPIEDQFTTLQATNLALLQNTSFGVAYESDRAYLLYTFTNPGDVGPSQCFRFNYLTNAWSIWAIAKNCGGVNPADNKLYQGNANLPILDVERKNLTYSDYADYSSTQTISSVTGQQVAISGSDTLQVGSVIWQSANVFGTVQSINPITGVAVTTLNTTLVAGPADILSPVSCDIAWAPLTLANPGMSKQLREVTLMFLSDFNGIGTVGFSSDVYPGMLTETITGGNVGTWGLFAWGGPGDTPLGVPWGGANRRRPIRVAIPRNHQRSSILTINFSHSYAYSPWKLQGISVIGDLTSERVSN